MEVIEPWNKPVTTNETLSPDIQAQVDYYNNIGVAVRLYVTPFIIFGVTVGNILTIIVVVSYHFRNSPSSVLLLALAIVDTGVLYFNLLDVWLGALLGGNSVQIMRDQGPYGCKISLFLTYFLTHSSSWIIVLINIDRVITLYQPLKARTWCTKKHLSIALLVMFIILALINIHVFWTARFFDEYDSHKCRFDFVMLGSKGDFEWLVVDATIFTYAPFIIILSCNIAIIIALHKAAMHLNSDSAAHDSTTSITTMLITISVVFLITTSPLTICYQFYDQIMLQYRNDPVGEALCFDLLIDTFLVLLCYSNNAVNFLLYCFSGSKFRRALVDICRKPIRRHGDPISQSTSQTTQLHNTTQL